jgi:hypothetical protein
VTEASTCTPTSTRPAPLPAMQSRVSSTLAPAGGPRAAFSGHVRLATKPHASRTSNRECATSHAVPQPQVVGPSPPSEPVHVPRVYCGHSCTSTVVYGSPARRTGLCVGVFRPQPRRWCIVVERKARNTGNTTPVVPVCSLAQVSRSRDPFGWTSAQRPPLNAACSCTTPVTTVSHSLSPISSNQSHSSSSHSPPLADRTLGGGLASQLWSRTVTRSPTHRSVPYDHLPAAANSAEAVTPPRRRSTPFNGLGSHTSLRGG